MRQTQRAMSWSTASHKGTRPGQPLNCKPRPQYPTHTQTPRPHVPIERSLRNSSVNSICFVELSLWMPATMTARRLRSASVARPDASMVVSGRLPSPDSAPNAGVVSRRFFIKFSSRLALRISTWWSSRFRRASSPSMAFLKPARRASWRLARDDMTTGSEAAPSGTKPAAVDAAPSASAWHPPGRCRQKKTRTKRGTVGGGREGRGVSEECAAWPSTTRPCRYRRASSADHAVGRRAGSGSTGHAAQRHARGGRGQRAVAVHGTARNDQTATQKSDPIDPQRVWRGGGRSPLEAAPARPFSKFRILHAQLTQITRSSPTSCRPRRAKRACNPCVAPYRG